MGQRPIGSQCSIHENENMCRVLASKDRVSLGESSVIFGYTYVSNGKSP